MWYLPHSHVHNERTVPIIMAGCMAYARNGRISTSGLKSDATIIDPEFEFYEFFSLLKFNEFYEFFFRLKKIRKKFVILQIIDV